MKAILKRTGLMIGVAATLTLAVVAQQTPTTMPQTATVAPEQRERMDGQRHRGMGKAGRGMREKGGGRGMKMFRDLNLNDAQKQQLRAIHQKTEQGTQAQRTELRQLMRQRQDGGQLTPEQETRARQLHTEIREARKGIRSDMLGVLTPEQRTQLEQKRRELKARRKEMREGRGTGEEQNKQQP